jgi:hypothetical protein
MVQISDRHRQTVGAVDTGAVILRSRSETTATLTAEPQAARVLATDLARAAADVLATAPNELAIDLGGHDLSPDVTAVVRRLTGLAERQGYTLKLHGALAGADPVRR